MKRCSTSLTVKERWHKTTVRNHHIHQLAGPKQKSSLAQSVVNHHNPGGLWCTKPPELLCTAAKNIKWYHFEKKFGSFLHLHFDLESGASLVAQMVKNLPAIQETWVWSLGRENTLKEEMATYSSILAWTIPWTEEPGGLQSIGSQRVGQDLATKQQKQTTTNNNPLTQRFHC